jgi:hypothetical protein
MSIFIDIAGSLAIRATIAAIVVSMNIMLNDVMFERTQRAIVRQDLATMTDIIRNDAQYIGHWRSGTPKVSHSATDFRFYGDIDSDFSADNVRFYFTVDPSGEGRSLLNRTVNGGDPLLIGRGITSWQIEYYDSVGAVTGSQNLARSFFLKFDMERSEALNVNGTIYYPSSSWEMHFFPRYLANDFSH